MSPPIIIISSFLNLISIIILKSKISLALMWICVICALPKVSLGVVVTLQLPLHLLLLLDHFLLAFLTFPEHVGLHLLPLLRVLSELVLLKLVEQPDHLGLTHLALLLLVAEVLEGQFEHADLVLVRVALHHLVDLVQELLLVQEPVFALLGGL